MPVLQHSHSAISYIYSSRITLAQVEETYKKTDVSRILRQISSNVYVR